MPKHILYIFLMVIFFAVSGILFAQQCEVSVANISFESTNSLTFDVFVKNTGLSGINYSHGSYAWNYDPAFLNGGTAAFSLVPGFSDFAAGAYPPSALITSPNILRTSSNLPGSNGTILPDQTLRLYRFRLQTSAASFASENFSISWKSSTVPYTRVFSWDSGTGLPIEVTNLEYSVMTLFWEENFDYTVGGLVSGSGGNWVSYSGSTGSLVQVSSSSLSYSGYQSSGLFNKIDILYLTSSGEDVYRQFPAQGEGTVTYSAFLLNLANTTGLAANSSTTGDYFISYLPGTSTTTLNSRISIKSGSVANTFQIGLRTSSSNAAAVWHPVDLNPGTTYLIAMSYEVITGTANDVASVWINPPVDGTQPTPDLTQIAGVDLAEVARFVVRQGSSGTPNASIDGIRVATTWTEIFPPSGTPFISVTPSSLSGFSYSQGGGPSTSQSYSLSGSNLTPASGNISVTGSTNYEVSLNNTTFSGSVIVPYSGGSLSSTPVYVRLKAGLTGGTYNGEEITNTGGGATSQVVTCSGFVIKPEPTNHVTNFAGVNGTPSYYYIILNWIDATGGTTPDGYLIKGSSFAFDSIAAPVDGVPETNSLFVQNINQGIQTKTFGFNSATTYYFKIFPYTNSGSIINYKTNGVVPQFSIATTNAPSLPLTENFEYVTGSFLTDNGWLAHSGSGTNPISIQATPLTYSGYVNSGLGKSISMNSTGEDDNRAFNSVTAGSLYASFMVNFSSAQTAGDYFFHLGPENTTSLYFAKIFVKKNAGDSLAIGVAKRNNGDVAYTSFSYALNTTYLIAVKYSFNSATNTDDEVKLWINPVLDGIEPSATISQTDLGEDALSLGMMALRQGSSSNAATLTLGGIRVANSWIPSAGSSTFQLSINLLNGWNMVSVPGTNPNGMGVANWWPGRVGDVYKYNAGYQTVTTATPGVGYWMKNNGAQTYNTGDEWPAGGLQVVAHTPLTGAIGWNMIGGYEIAATASLVTTVPAGLQSGPIYKYAGGYSAAATIDPGFGYWIKLTGAGQIIIPESFAKDSKPVEYFPENWGRIVITDAAGVSYTLYAVNGQVDLSQYELPPAPPAGMYDFRYTSGRIAEDLSSSVKTIEMSGVVYPLTVRVEGMDIRLMDESGKKLNENLKDGESIEISESTIEKLMVSGELLPTVYSLEQNYPNPFNPSTVIEFSLPEDVANVKLSIYNALGEKVSELVNTSLQAGKYQYTWNAQDVATGMYIYELRTDKFVSVKKMVLVK